MARNRRLPDTASVAHAEEGARLHAPSNDSNGAALTEIVRSHAPARGQALEIASGTGQHMAAFARARPHLAWQPTEIDPARRASIDAWCESAGNVAPAIALDATTPGWGVRHGGQALVVLVNLLHLVSAAEARIVIAEAAQALAPGGRFILYGPFLRDGVATSEGDRRFDASLRACDPEIGYKDAAQIRDWLDQAGLAAVTIAEMPANNLTFISEAPAEVP